MNVQQKDPPFVRRSGQRMGHPGLRCAQPSKRPMLLHGEDCQWYHPHVWNAKDRACGESCATRLHPFHLEQLDDEGIGHSVGEVVRLWVAPQIGHGQNG